MIILLNTTILFSLDATTALTIEDLRSKFEPWLWDKLQRLELESPGRHISLIIRLENAEAKYQLGESLNANYDVQKVDVLEALPVIIAKVKVSDVNRLASNPLIKHIGDGEAVGRGFLDVATQTIGAQITRATFSVNGSGITIAILDSGINATHPDLDDLDDDPNTTDPKVISGVSFVDYDNDGIADEDPMDYYGHGTYVAGIAAGTGQASNGTYRGVAPGAKLVNVKVLNKTNQLEAAWVVQGIDWVIQKKETFNIKVVSMSVGIIYPYPHEDDGTSEISQAADAAVNAGLVVTVAIGNFGAWDWDYPGNFYKFDDKYVVRPPASPAVALKVIAVGASNDLNTTSISDDKMWIERVRKEGTTDIYWNIIHSRAGPTNLTINPRIKPDVVAPGANITSTWRGGGYTTGSGTSAATPLVAGAATLILQKHPSWTPARVKEALKSTAELNYDLNNTYNNYEYGPENIRGTGIINVTKAISTLHLTVRTYIGSSELSDVNVWIDSDSARLSPVSVNITFGSHTVKVESMFYRGVAQYKFIYWENGATDNPRTINVTDDMNITAYYNATYLCPILYVWNGTHYVEEAALDIHSPEGVDKIVNHTLTNSPALTQNQKYHLKLVESPYNQSQSFIDNVKFYIIDEDGIWHQSNLASATHSESGNVKVELLYSDDNRAHILPLQEILLEFTKPNINDDEITGFVFVIEGYNPKPEPG